MIHNVENLGDAYHVGIRIDRDMKKGEWINLTVQKHHVKDRSLDDDILLKI